MSIHKTYSWGCDLLIFIGTPHIHSCPRAYLSPSASVAGRRMVASTVRVCRFETCVSLKKSGFNLDFTSFDSWSLLIFHSKGVEYPWAFGRSCLSSISKNHWRNSLSMVGTKVHYFEIWITLKLDQLISSLNPSWPRGTFIFQIFIREVGSMNDRESELK